MNVATRKIQVYVNESDIELKNNYYNTLRDYQYKSYRYANEIVNNAFFTDKLQAGLGANNDRLSAEELKNKLYDAFGKGASKMNFGYKFASEEFKQLPSTIRASLNSIVFASYNEDKKEVLKGNKSIRNYKRNMPVPFMKTAITQIKQDNKEFTLNLFSIPLKTNLGRDKSNNKAILENILNNNYQLCDSSFSFDGNKMFILLTFKSPVKQLKLDPNKTLGVDLGINVPVVTAINDTITMIGSKEDFINKRLALQKSKRNTQKNLVFTTGGKGRNKKLKKLDNYREKEANFAKTYNHQLSRKIVDTAIVNNCQFINIEDLSSYKENGSNWVLRNWSYSQLQSMIEYKAKKVGITVRKINPQYTSQCCSKCGHISPDNRESQENFICKSCNNELNADANAAINISNAHQDFFINRINQYKKTLKKVDKLQNVL